MSDAAALSGVAAGTIKAYEKDGLIAPRRDSRGARLFVMKDIEAIKQIAEARLARHGKTGRRVRIIATSTSTG